MVKSEVNENILGENIKRFLKRKGITQQQLADVIGISRVYLSDLIRGKKGKRIPQSTLRKIAQALGVSVAELLTTLEEKKDRLKSITEVTDTVVIPVYKGVVAGQFKDISDAEIIDYLPTPKVALKGVAKEQVAWVQVEGDSMSPEIENGDYVLITDGSWASINNGDRVIAIYDGEATLKRFYDKGNIIILQPINDQNYELIIINKDEINESNPLYLYKVLAMLKM